MRENDHDLILNDPTLRARFGAKHQTEPSTGCELWSASTDHHGYGRVGVGGAKGRWFLAHRVAWVLSGRRLPDPPLQFDHLCRRRRCVNPEHLEVVTARENTLRGYAPAALSARATHCPNGHPWNEANTRKGKDGRKCRACERERALATYHRTRRTEEQRQAKNERSRRHYAANRARILAQQKASKAVRMERYA